MGPLAGYHKIGKTNNPGRRRSELGSLLPVELHIVHLIETVDMEWLERYMHASFKHCRVRGEWFNLTEMERVLLASVDVVNSAEDIPPQIVWLHDDNLRADPVTAMRLNDATVSKSEKVSLLSRAIGRNVRWSRELKGLTQRELADATEMHASGIARLEAGSVEPEVWTLWRVAEALGVPLCELVGDPN